MDVVKISSPDNPHFRACECGESWGRYTDDVNAEYGGQAIPFGINNLSFHLAIRGELLSFEGWFYPGYGKNRAISSEHITFQEDSSQGAIPDKLTGES